MASSILGSTLTVSSPALAQGVVTAPIGAGDIILLSALIGTVSFAVISAISLIRARGRADAENRRLLLDNANLRALADRAESLLNVDDQRLVVWEARTAAPIVTGDLPRAAAAPSDRASFLAFGRWLAATSASDLDASVARLRDKGEPFVLPLTTQTGAMLEAVGRTVGGRAAVRFRDLTGDRLALASLESAHRLALAELTSLKTALDAVPVPAWIRGKDGRLVWVNAAYASAVEAADSATAIATGAEALDTATREAIAAVHTSSPLFQRRLSVVVGGDRRLYDVTDAVTADGSAGIAVDATAIEVSQAAMQRIVDFHARTLDQLATAVAVFGPDHRLRSYNEAYRSLFGLDAGFLETQPDEAAILDTLRTTRKLPEQADFRSWKHELLSAYQSIEASESLWHLPEGVTLRVLANPHPQGGMTWIYENVTERLDLESRYNALSRVQGETLDHLREGVAVFGSDGRLRLNNPAFADICHLDVARLGDRPHIRTVATQCKAVFDAGDFWDQLTTSIAGVDESRGSAAGRAERSDGRVVDYATVPLPQGQTMVTLVDITDSVQVERALIDRNEALLTADRLKNEFIQHVSYELRSPLTNIIGFTQLVADTNIGPLNDKQREYVGYVLSSSGALLALVNDILDLATIDAGIMALDLGVVDLPAAVDASIEGLRDRLSESRIQIDSRIAPDIGSLVADEKRLRQILYNLISNAVSFSGEGGHVLITARRTGGDIVIDVEDEGVGIPDDFIGLVFDRFESRPGGAMRGGAGLGLAIVKSFVELHGGTVVIKSTRDKGTLVRVTLPAAPHAVGVAAE